MRTLLLSTAAALALSAPALADDNSSTVDIVQNSTNNAVTVSQVNNGHDSIVNIGNDPGRGSHAGQSDRNVVTVTQSNAANESEIKIFNNSDRNGFTITQRGQQGTSFGFAGEGADRNVAALSQDAGVSRTGSRIWFQHDADDNDVNVQQSATLRGRSSATLDDASDNDIDVRQRRSTEATSVMRLDSGSDHNRVLVEQNDTGQAPGGGFATRTQSNIDMTNARRGTTIVLQNNVTDTRAEVTLSDALRTSTRIEQSAGTLLDAKQTVSGGSDNTLFTRQSGGSDMLSEQTVANGSNNSLTTLQTGTALDSFITVMDSSNNTVRHDQAGNVQTATTNVMAGSHGNNVSVTQR
ncbi:MAG: hypothetical protein KDE35_06355 [Geminicoccaceae bacterium]|nr:hypothetical protein [Geminicoccaceae bacterium]